MTHTNHKNFHIYTAVLMLCILLAACSDSLFDGDGGKLAATTAYSYRAVSSSWR